MALSADHLRPPPIQTCLTNGAKRRGLRSNPTAIIKRLRQQTPAANAVPCGLNFAAQRGLSHNESWYSQSTFLINHCQDKQTEIGRSSATPRPLALFFSIALTFYAITLLSFYETVLVQTNVCIVSHSYFCVICGKDETFGNGFCDE
jgi:hypothetical protein